MSGKLRTACVLACGVLWLMVGRTAANPLIAIHTEQDWLNAMQDNIRPVEANVFQNMVTGDDQWPDEYRFNCEFYTPQLYVEGDYENEAGLVMEWGQPDGTEIRRAAAWDFIYGVDPDLNGTLIEFSIFPPVPSTLVSLNLIDKNGNYREWIWHAGDAGELPPGVWSDLLINPATGWSNWPTFGGSPFIHDQPGMPFDLSSIQILRFNENIWSTPGFPGGPGGNLPDGWVWNMWNHVEVRIPEPGTMTLLGLGGLILLLCRRRRR